LGEGFGKTQVEVMAYGCALVTTANGGSGDFAFHGETALVSDPRDVDTIARHIATLLRENPSFFMGLPD
jgi:glycosyltransferase involved in cell wall biosynthesis